MSLTPVGGLAPLPVFSHRLERPDLVLFKNNTVCLAAAKLLKHTTTPATLLWDKHMKNNNKKKKTTTNAIKKEKSCLAKVLDELWELH